MVFKAELCWAILLVVIFNCSSFSPPSQSSPIKNNQWKNTKLPTVFVSTAKKGSLSEQQHQSDDDSETDDERLLKMTPKSEIVALCEQFDLSTKGTKAVLLQRLREYAVEQKEAEKERLMKRKKKVEEGTEDDRERYEVVDDTIDDDDVEDEIFFYYESKVTTEDTDKKGDSKKEKTKNEIVRDSGFVTAPPPTGDNSSDDEERVVTIYSTDEKNDLTGVAAAQPGQTSFDPMTSSTSLPTDAPWDTNNPRKADLSSAEVNAAKEAVIELVRTLLSMTGLPGFMTDQEDDNIQLMRGPNLDAPAQYIDFDPSMVTTEFLTKASRSIRTSRGKILREVLRDFELRAIGDDGTAVDNVQRGGGHYRQVTRVRAFLEGFRQAEVNRLSRDTVTLLLDKLVSEGIEGIDITLASMIRSNDDTSDEGGELNDSLLEFLDDMVRQQEKKVEQGVDSTKKIAEFERAITEDVEDQIESLWKVEDENGERIETFDPNDPNTQLKLKEEYEKVALESIPVPILPSSAPEKLLLMLKILRERLKIEATFSHDEKTRNLRILAYCLQLKTDALRKEMIGKEFGGSLDRLDSFEELVTSSIEYGESTSHQLMPSKTGSLNVPLLKVILKVTRETRKDNTWKASGGIIKPGP